MDQTDNQETYLAGSSFWDVTKRGAKKLMTEVTSVKFLLLVFVCLGVWQKFIGDSLGLGVALVIVGLREVPVDQIMAKLTGDKPADRPVEG